MMIKIGETAFSAPYKKGIKQIVYRKGKTEKSDQHGYNQRDNTALVAGHLEKRHQYN